MTPARRPSMGEALAGRDAVYGSSDADSGARSAARAPAAAGKGPRWDETHSRATFHLPLELQRALDQEAKGSGRSKSQVVADALREHLGAGSSR